jgi:hypothetical protein
MITKGGEPKSTLDVKFVCGNVNTVAGNVIESLQPRDVIIVSLKNISLIINLLN